MNTSWLMAGALLVLMSTAACDASSTQSDQMAHNTEDTGRFEVVRERAGADGRLEIRVRAEDLDAADRIARKLAERKKSTNQRVARVEFIDMRDPEDGPARRTIQNP